MAEEQGSAVAEEAFQYNIQIEDAGPATKKVKVEIPADRIKGKLAEQYKELRSQAAIPGFRVGHAPAKLIEKRFAADVKDQVRRTLISESYEQAVEKNSLQVIGEPQFDNPDAIELKDDQALTYSFEIEVQPEITLPLLTGLKVKKPKIDIKDENIDQAMNNLREQQGALVPARRATSRPPGARGRDQRRRPRQAAHRREGRRNQEHHRQGRRQPPGRIHPR
jgi:trigger factor